MLLKLQRIKMLFYLTVKYASYLFVYHLIWLWFDYQNFSTRTNFVFYRDNGINDKFMLQYDKVVWELNLYRIKVYNS